MWISTVYFWLLAVCLFPKLKGNSRMHSNHNDATPTAKQPSYEVSHFKGILKKKESDRGLTAFPFEVHSIMQWFHF